MRETRIGLFVVLAVIVAGVVLAFIGSPLWAKGLLLLVIGGLGLIGVLPFV